VTDAEDAARERAHGTRALPSLSVVVVSVAGPPLLEQALGALALQEPEPPREILVVTQRPLEAAAETFSPASTIRVFVEEGNVPLRRARGAAAATGDVVAILEDSCVPAPRWADALRKAHARGAAAIGGAVIPSPQLPAASVATFLVEFGAYLQAVGLDGNTAAAAASQPSVVPARQLAGCNLSYARSLLDAERDAWRAGLYETFLHERMAARGAPLLFASEALVIYGACTPLARAMSERFHHGRTYGGIRHRGRGLSRLAFAAAGPLLPALIAGRIAGSLLRAGSAGRRLWSAYPWTLPLAAAWSAGETVGALAGPGASAEKWA
jgi:GT2 family glycosyltransferase